METRALLAALLPGSVAWGAGTAPFGQPGLRSALAGGGVVSLGVLRTGLLTAECLADLL